jgi:hypothetical protein
VYPDLAMLDLSNNRLNKLQTGNLPHLEYLFLCNLLIKVAHNNLEIFDEADTGPLSKLVEL